MYKPKRIRIVNETGIGRGTKVFVIGSTGEETELPFCRKVTINPICANGLITASIEFSRVEVDIEASLLKNE